MCARPTRRCASARRRVPQSYLKIDAIVDACRKTRRRGRASRLRVPLRECRVRAGAGQGRHRLHRPEYRGRRGDGRQDRIQEAGAEGRRQHDSRPSRGDRRRGRSGEDRAQGRLPGDGQGLGRRRRQGHAHRAQRCRGARRLQVGDQRGQIELRRRSRLHREIRRGAAPHRDPGAGRLARQCRSIWASANARSSAATRR